MHRYKYNNRIYSIENCLDSDVAFHVDRLRPYWEYEIIPQQTQRMKDAVYSGTAYKLVNDKNQHEAFGYYKHMTENEVEGIALWFMNLHTFIIFAAWHRFHTPMQYIHIKPHEGWEKGQLPKLVEDRSVKEHYKTGSALYIDLFGAKIQPLQALWERMNVVEV